jgi:hypothetical protein
MTLRRWFVLMTGVLAVATVKAQYIPAYQTKKPITQDSYETYWHKKNLLKHMEVSLTLGTTGIGLDIAAPLCEYVQVRAGYDYMPPFRKKFKVDVLCDGQAAAQYDGEGNRVETPFDVLSEEIYQQTGYELESKVGLTGQLTMNNAKLLVDIYPLKYDKSWHITAGVYWGLAQFAKADQNAESEKMLQYVRDNNRLSLAMGKLTHDVYQKGEAISHKGDVCQVEPAEDGSVQIRTTSNSWKPYLGFGYGGRLIPKRGDWKVTVEVGALIWGGMPTQRMHDGTDLSEDVENISGNLGTCVDIIKFLKVYPVLSVRFAKILF